MFVVVVVQFVVEYYCSSADGGKNCLSAESWRISLEIKHCVDFDVDNSTGCLKLLQLLVEILETSWNSVDAPGKFCN